MSDFSRLQEFFSRDVSTRATKPLKDNIEIALHLDSLTPVCLTKTDGKLLLKESVAKSPDMSFWVSSAAINQLCDFQTEDIGEIGIQIIKLMLTENTDIRLKVKVHIGSIALFTHGYLGVLPLGGATVMKFLASKGFSNIGKIKDAISKVRG